MLAFNSHHLTLLSTDFYLLWAWWPIFYLALVYLLFETSSHLCYWGRRGFRCHPEKLSEESCLQLTSGFYCDLKMVILFVVTLKLLYISSSLEDCRIVAYSSFSISFIAVLLLGIGSFRLWKYSYSISSSWRSRYRYKLKGATILSSSEGSFESKDAMKVTWLLSTSIFLRQGWRFSLEIRMRSS